MEARAYDPDLVQLPTGSFIDGRMEPNQGAAYDILRPSDGRLAVHEQGASRQQVDRAVSVAAEAFRTSGWPRMHPRQRGRVLRRWAELVEAHAEELAVLESVTSVRLVNEARLRDVPGIAELIRYNAELADKIDGEVLASDAKVFNLVVREPYGVVAGIVPWNAPLVLSTIKLAPALAVGNAVVLKPSEMTPFSLVRLAQLAVEAGVPAGMISVLPGLGGEAGHALVTHAQVAHVSFTGSTATGARVMADAALHGCKAVSLELGGKSPQLVFNDVADLDRLADIVAGSICRNAGQVCFAGTRLVIDETLLYPVLGRLRERLARMRPGPTWDTGSTLAPIFSAAQAARIDDILERARGQGAELLQGGRRVPAAGEGIYLEPTVLLATDARNPAVLEEFFGPVLTVQPFKTFEEGLELANHPVYGLAAAVHTADMGKALTAARAIEAGVVWVNHYGPTADVNNPVAPYKQSGTGVDGGVAGLAKFQKIKNIRMQWQ